MTDQSTGSAPDLLAVYLFNGDDELKRDTLLKRLADRIAVSGNLLLDQATISSEQVKDPDLLLDSLTTSPLGGSYRLVVLTNAEKLNKNLSETLISYLKNPTETTVLVLLANRLASNTRLYKAIVGYNKRSLIDVSSVKRSELPNWLRDLANDYRLSLDYQAAQALIDRIGTSITALNNELRRLAAWAQAVGKSQLTVVDIVAQVPALVEPKPWELADAICERQAATALQIYSEMYSASDTSIFLHCLERLREVLKIVALRQRGIKSNNQIASEIGRPEWQIRGSIQAANRFSETELREVIKDAHNVEAALKSGSDGEQILMLWLLRVCTGNSAKPA